MVMSITSFYKINGENNAPGYYDFAFIPDDEILFLPDPVSGIINLNDLVLIAEAQFLSGYATINTLMLGDELKQSAHGGLSPVELGGSTPLVNNLNLHLFSKMAQKRFVILARDNNGRWYIGGEPGNGLIFTFKRKASALEFNFTGQYSHICWEVQGNILLDGSIVDTGNIVDCNCPDTPGGGDGEGGGSVAIKRVDGTTITTVTAPAEYTVANTNAVLKDTAGTTLSTTSIKAAGAAQEITAPNATINIKDSAGALLDTVTAKSNETKEVNIGDAEVQFVDTAGAPIGDVAVKATETKEVEIADSTVEITNTLEEIIATVTVKANNSTTQLIADSDLTLNGGAWTEVPANSSKNIALVDENGSTLTPLLADSTQIKVNTNAALVGYIYGNL